MNVATLERRASLTLDTYVVDCVWSADGTALAVAGGEGAVLLVEQAAREPRVRALGEHAMGTLAVAWQPNGATIASSGQDGTVVLWSADGASPPQRLTAAKGAATVWTEHLAYAPSGKFLATAAAKTLSIWSAAGELVAEVAPHAAAIVALSWNKRGRDLAAATHGAMWVHRVEPPKVTSQRYALAGACLTAAFSPNGQVLAAGTQDGAVHFWHVAAARDSDIRGYDSKVMLTVWSANSRHLATSAGNEIVIWDFGGKGPEGTEPLQLAGHTARIDCLAYQPNGPWLASGGRDWRVSLWLPGKATQAVDAHLAGAEISALRWSPDGRYLAVGERRGGVSVYELVTRSASAAR